jgi:hypothetical protein
VDVNTDTVHRPVRIGVFATVREADAAVQGLLSEGFAASDISVVCSDKSKESFFAEFEHDKPAGETAPAKAQAGALAGLIAGGALAVAGVVATGGAGLLIVGPLFAGTGAAVGTFVGAMTSRGTEREVANFYDQALRDGQILVSAETAPDADRARLQAAERVFRDAGARPVPLPKG